MVPIDLPCDFLGTEGGIELQKPPSIFSQRTTATRWYGELARALEKSRAMRGSRHRRSMSWASPCKDTTACTWPETRPRQNGPKSEGFQEWLSRGDPTKLLLLHDTSTSFWKENCSTLMQFVRDGGVAVVSIAPPDVAGCSLPAFAWEVNEARFVDLRPRLTFVLDDSRIGRLAYKATEPMKLEEESVLQERPLADSVELQARVLEGALSLLGWSPLRERPAHAKGAAKAPAVCAGHSNSITPGSQEGGARDRGRRNAC